MRKLLVIAVVLGAGGFAAVSQAGMSLRPADLGGVEAKSDRIVTRYDVPNCRIEKSLKYDFNGNPYMKKVRICA
jgi:hypothetical protein